MSSLKQQNEAEMEQDGSLAEYYHALTLAAVHHPADLLVIHYGLSGPDTSSDSESDEAIHADMQQGVFTYRLIYEVKP